MSSDFKYYAFISYSHEDATWAKRIHRELEAFRLPTALQKTGTTNLPKSVRPIFLDETDLGVGKLQTKLHGELDQSKYLIVLCSPHSAVPNSEGLHWVENEVAHFCEQGREDRIIPVIVGGTAQTAFCPSLKKANILALDATKTPRRRVVSDIVAKILGLSPDELWRREQRRWRRKMLWRTIACFIQTAIFCSFVWYVVDWNMECVRYFRQCEESFGVQVENPSLPSTGLAEGVFEIRKDQLPSVSRAYRFHYQGYNSLLPWKRKPMLRKVVNVNANDMAIEDYKKLHQLSVGRRYDYDERGRLSAVVSIDSKGEPVKRGDGVAKVIYEYDDLGRITEIRFLNVSDKAVVPPGLFCKQVHFEYSGGCTNIWKMTGYLGNGSLEVHELNIDGKPICVSLFNQDETPAKIKPFEVYKIVRKYDEKSGKEVSREFRDENDQSMTIPNTKIMGITLSYDDDSNVTEERYFGSEGQLVADITGVARVMYHYTNVNFVASVDFYGLDDQREANRDGISGIRREYDEKGRLVAEWNIDKKGDIIPNRFGVKIARNTFDKDGNITACRFFDEKGQRDKGMDGTSGWTSKFEKGLEVKHRYINEDDVPCLQKDGTGGWNAAYDEYGRTTMRESIDAHENVIATPGIGLPLALSGIDCPCIRVTYEYLADGHVKTIALLDKAAAKFLEVESIVLIRNQQRQLERLVLYGNDGKIKTSSALGFAIKRFSHGPGQRIEESYWSEREEPVLFKLHGIHKRTISSLCSVDGLILDARCYDAENFLTMSQKLGYAYERKHYDKDGRLVDVETYDENRKLIRKTAAETNLFFAIDENGMPIDIERK